MIEKLAALATQIADLVIELSQAKARNYQLEQKVKEQEEEITRLKAPEL